MILYRKYNLFTNRIRRPLRQQIRGQFVYPQVRKMESATRRLEDCRKTYIEFDGTMPSKIMPYTDMHYTLVYIWDDAWKPLEKAAAR